MAANSAQKIPISLSVWCFQYQSTKTVSTYMRKPGQECWIVLSPAWSHIWEIFIINVWIGWIYAKMWVILYDMMAMMWSAAFLWPSCSSTEWENNVKTSITVSMQPSLTTQCIIQIGGWKYDSRSGLCSILASILDSFLVWNRIQASSGNQYY